MKNYFLTKLKNGMQVLTVPMAGRESLAIGIWVRTGARYEQDRAAGVSHFLEHMLFKGTETRSAQQIKQAIEGVGGVMNAFTSEEVTCYFTKLLKPHRAIAMEVLADMIQNSRFPALEVEKERAVILEEIKMYKDLPAHEAHEKISELLWGQHSLGRPIAGSEKTVRGLSRQHLMDYWKKYYQPQNILVSVSGSISHREVLDLAQRSFVLSKHGSPSRFTKSSFAKPANPFWIQKKKIEQTHWVMAFEGLARVHPDRYKLSLLHVMLGANMSSRLFEEVREKRGLAYEIKSGLMSYLDTGAFLVSAGVESSKAAESIRVVWDELRLISQKAPAADELRRAKDFFLSQICMGVEDTLDHLLWVGDRVISGRDVPDLNKIRRNVEAVTPEQIRALAQKLFQNKKLRFSAVGPLTSSMQKAIRKTLKAS